MVPLHNDPLRFKSRTKRNRVDLSIVVPALNEQITISEFVRWCREGLKKAQVSGQILIVDSSTDNTARLAHAGGAEVLIVPRQGLGQAYIDAIPFIRGKWVLVGDADLTYDFRQLSPFVEELKAGKEFIMGKRFKGHIVKGDVPVLHQYFVTPLTTWILNLLYRTNFTDIHCGMRGITLKALQKIRLQSQGWEYASELVQSPLFIASPQKKLNKIYLAGLKAWTNKKIYVCHIGLVF